MPDPDGARTPGRGGPARDVAPYEPPPSTAVAAPARGRRRKDPWRGATIADVVPGSSAQREGLEPGMIVTHVNGAELRDLIVWQWEADGPDAHLEGVAYPGTAQEFEFECDLSREPGQQWGVVFDGAVFDGMRLCRNNCTFCFMKMLPKGMRGTLYLRDDDYRLSFLQGNFVTLTNMSDQDVTRVVEQRLEPLNVSLHAVTPQVRRDLIGVNQARGMEVLHRLVQAGIEVHAQVVLVPGANDGGELRRTLEFVEERPAITSLGIVPLGYTKYQETFTSSYSEDPAASASVVELVAEFQERSRRSTGRTRYQLADEFYLFGGVEPPSSEYYDGYPQYYDGIGMVRSFLDDLKAARADPALMAGVARSVAALRSVGARLVLACGRASEGLAGRALKELGATGAASVAGVDNRYFGGNVDVSGLLTAQDVLGQIAGVPATDRRQGEAVENPSASDAPVPGGTTATDAVCLTRVLGIPRVMLNSQGLTLDGADVPGMRAGLPAGWDLVVFDATPSGIAQALDQAAALAGGSRGRG